VIIPEMPEGVEHHWHTKRLRTMPVIIPEMPEGVEHCNSTLGEILAHSDYS